MNTEVVLHLFTNLKNYRITNISIFAAMFLDSRDCDTFPSSPDHVTNAESKNCLFFVF